MDLESGIHRPYCKDDSVPTYININSNHPPHIKKNLPNMISERISRLSSNEQIFNQEAALYNEGLKQAGYKDKIKYVKKDENVRPRSRKRNIIYFCPPWNDALATNLGRRFLELIDHHFPRDSPLHKLFNRNCVKLSYSCTKNIKSIITSNNAKLLRPTNNNDNRRQCNCRSAQNCPLDGRCLQESVVYSSKVVSNVGTREYIGVTKNTFKERWDGHNFDARHIGSRHRTTLANHIWTLKENNVPFVQTWAIESNARSYSPEVGHCDACRVEKYLIFKYFRARKLTNRRHELCNKCRHLNGFLLTNHSFF